MGGELAGRRVLVLGLGRFTGGAGAVRFLCQEGARVRVTDLRTAEQLSPTLATLQDLAFEGFFGGHPEEALAGAELAVVNPAIPPEAPYLAEIRSRGIPTTSELELFLARCRAPVVAVTGTNGKSTTTAMTGAVLGEDGTPVHVGGNVGLSLLPAVGRIAPDHRVVLEVSSFQGDLLPPGPWLDVLVVTHVTEDHLDRYRIPSAYQDSKRRFLGFLKPGGAAVLNRADPVSGAWALPPGIRRTTFGEDEPGEGEVGVVGGVLLSRLTDPAGRPLLPRRELPLPGSFQVQNVLAAAAAGELLGASPAVAAAALRRFRGLDHRLQPLGRIGGVALYDNGVSTVPETTLSALEAIPGPIQVTIGGKTKGADLARFAEALAPRAAGIHLFGKVGPELAREVARLLPAGRWSLSTGVEDALDQALAAAGSAGTLLFSPAFSSFDAYQNFRDRAQVFRAWAAARGLQAPP